MLRAGVIVMTMMMMMMMMLMVKDAWSLDATDVNVVAGLSPPSFEDSYGVVASDVGSDGRCTCSVLSPSDSVCSTDNRYKQIKYLHAQVEQLQAIVSEMQTGTFLQHYTELRRKIAAIEAERDLVLVSESEFLQLKQEIIILDRLVQGLPAAEANAAQISVLKSELRNITASLQGLETSQPHTYKLQEEVDRLRERLAACQEQYGDHSAVSGGYLFTRNGSIPVSCNDETLGGILQPVTHAWESALVYGAWMMDPLPPTGDETKIYVLGGYANNRALWMYGNYADFVTRRRKTVITLPTGVGGTGHVIYNGTIYYPQYNSAKVNAFDLRSRKLTAASTLPGALFQNAGQFSFGAYADIDLAADERGLWAVYTTTANDGYIVISKLHPVTLQVLNTWKTNAKKLKVGNTFFICGVMYAIEAHTILDNRVSYQYDTNTQEQNLISIPFSIKYGLLNQMLYNARHRAIFAWDNGHLISYPVEFQPSR